MNAMPLDLDIRAADSLPLEELAAIFTAGFEGYVVPIQVDAEALATMVHAFDLDLGASRVAFVGEEPAGFALLGIRGDEGWIGGMGVRTADRRRGRGLALMEALLGEARDRGIRTVRLEVIDSNEGARRLYERLGFEHFRDVEVWTLAADVERAPAREAGLDDALARIRALRTAPEPWQRADGTIERLRESDRPVHAIADDGAALVYRVSGAAVSLLQMGVESEDTAVDLIRAARAAGGSLHALNIPVGDAASRALRELGGRADFRQHELALSLEDGLPAGEHASRPS
jgi:ribosomal protein S18 acetylase RimI-like enzyme